MQKYNHGYNMDYYSIKNKAEEHKGIYVEDLLEIIDYIEKEWILMGETDWFGIGKKKSSKFFLVKAEELQLQDFILDCKPIQEPV